MTDLNGKIIAETLAGYAEGQAYADQHRLTALKTLDTNESLTIYLALWRAWEASKPSALDIKELDKLKIAHLVERRGRLDRLARWKEGR